MTVKDAINKRYSTRRMNNQKKISSDDIKTIIEAGIKAPNGFGLEAWKFFVIDGEKQELCTATHNQQHILESSHVIVLAAYKDDYIKKNPKIINDRLDVMGISEEAKLRYQDLIFNKMSVKEYTYSQNHIAGGYMALQAADLGIGSVIVGGFDRSSVAQIIGLDEDQFEISLLVSLGYGMDEEAPRRKNRNYEEIVKYITL